ncbi:MAG TPA: polyphosphate kinase 1 [Phycisphaerales bacterium]|nr:polyphosphate kinase 1 [Phycisphaerales bacterium]HMP37323.1 polyphosphate kinase 1 [Phycisphaerales bacterium]
MNDPATHLAGRSGPAAPGQRPAESGRADAGSVRPALPGPEDSARFLNRELQWLAFNERVLHQALDERNPLLERVRFLAIFATNLDEFFMKRVGGLRRQVQEGVASSAEPLSPAQTLEAIRDRVIPMTRRLAACFRLQIRPALAAIGVHLLSWTELTPEERREAEQWYRRNVFPILTPLAVDSGHRFPFISNLSESLGVMLRRPGESEQMFARVKIPELPARWLELGAGKGHERNAARGARRFVTLQDIVEHNLDDLFPGMEIVKVMPFRVTRNADVDRDNEDAEDLMEEIEQQLRERRFARVVRLEASPLANPRLLRLVTEELELAESDIYEADGLLDYDSLYQIADLDIPEHRWAPWRPVVPPPLADDEKDIFAAIRAGEFLAHHPYESFDATVARLVEEAASDPRVLCIKQALYRTSGDSPFVRELIRAAENGKQVACLVELRARFDEARNILWANKLEDAGVHVAYGVVGLKTHTKIALVVRQENDGIRCYVHIGSGNYNSKTARLYEDWGLFTCDPQIAEDVVNLFNYMTGRSRQHEYNRLLVAPVTMKKRFLEMIDREIALHRPERPGRIVAKMNQLEDRTVTDALYRASQAGVQIDLIIRGFCCLRPGVPGLSENIRVISVIGRFLEHSRIFHFGAGCEDPLDGDFFIGSADWMYRNLHSRVEAIVPIERRPLRARLWENLRICLDDRRSAWEMDAWGRYALRSADGLPPGAPETLGTHQRLMNAALEAQEERSREQRSGERRAEELPAGGSPADALRAREPRSGEQRSTRR